MKKFIPVLILLIMVGVISVSGCIHYVDQDDNTSLFDSVNLDDQLNTDDTTSSNTNDVTSKDEQTDNTILKEDEIEDLMDNELKTNYTIEDSEYNITSFTQNNKEYFNISLEGLNKSSNNTVQGNVTMDASSGEIISMNLTEITPNPSKKEKIYSVNEAGDFIDIIYKGKQVSVRENYPYYSPQNDKVYYSQQEEAEDLIKLYEDFD